VRKEYYSAAERKHKLAPIADGPFKVLAVDALTVTVQMADSTEKVSRDRVVEAPNPGSHDTEAFAPTQGRRQAPVSASREYVIDHLVSHGLDDDDNYMYKVRWYGYSSNEDTWEYPEGIPRSAILTFYNKHKLPIPGGVLEKAQVG